MTPSYSCEKCGHGFVTKRQLMSHLESHESKDFEEVVEAAHQRLDKILEWYCVKMLEKEIHGTKFLSCINHFNSLNI